MLTIRTEKRIYQRTRSLDKARDLLSCHVTDTGKHIPKSAFIEYGPIDIKRGNFLQPEQNEPLGSYCLGHVI